MNWLGWFVLVGVVYWALRIKIQASKRNQTSAFNGFSTTSSAGASQSSNASANAAEAMVACTYCQLYLPISEALVGPSSMGQSHYFCCAEHRQLHAEKLP